MACLALAAAPAGARPAGASKSAKGAGDKPPSTLVHSIGETGWRISAPAGFALVESPSGYPRWKRVSMFRLRLPGSRAQAASPVEMHEYISVAGGTAGKMFDGRWSSSRGDRGPITEGSHFGRRTLRSFTWADDDVDRDPVAHGNQGRTKSWGHIYHLLYSELVPTYETRDPQFMTMDVIYNVYYKAGDYETPVTRDILDPARCPSREAYLKMLATLAPSAGRTVPGEAGDRSEPGTKAVPLLR